MFWAGLLLVLFAGCSGGDDPGLDGTSPPAPDAGSETTTSVCAPGAQVACACPGGEDGAQRCRDDGTGWEACLCPDASVGPHDASQDAELEASEDGPVETGQDAADEPDAVDYCPVEQARLLACSNGCAACVNGLCNAECVAIKNNQLATWIFNYCYCDCAAKFDGDDRVECYDLCDTTQAIDAEVEFAMFFACVRAHCPLECDPRQLTQ